MTLRDKMHVTLCVAILLAGWASAKPVKEKRPNIIYLMADDQNVGSVGCYGNPEVVTPNMDKLGNEAV